MVKDPRDTNTNTFAGPENFNNGIRKTDNWDNNFTEWGPILNGEIEGYWTKKYKDVELYSYYLFKNGVRCYEI